MTQTVASLSKLSNIYFFSSSGILSIDQLSKYQLVFLSFFFYPRGPFYAINKTDYKWCSISIPDGRYLPYKPVLLQLAPLLQARLAGLWPVRKKTLIPPVWCDTTWGDPVKRRALWCQGGCFECVGNILKLPVNTSRRKGVKNQGHFKNLRIHFLCLDLQISVQTRQ